MYRIENLFNPKSVALIGATDREGTIGRQLAKNLLLGKDMRKVYAVNPNRENVLGLKCFPSITEVPEHIDLAVIATPAKTVPEIVNECGQSGVDGAVIISAGFREVGEEGERLEDEINQFQEKHGLRILGPNCLGFVRPHAGLNATFLRNNPKPGEIAFISQSGALGTAILDWAVSTHVGFSMFASLGSMLNIDFGDLIDYLGRRACIRDPEVDGIIVIYTPQGTAQPRDLAKKVIKIAEKKLIPILTVWMGEKEVEGARKLYYAHNIPTFSTPEKAVRTYT
ncbi:MAG: CoA-binding protein [Euryarchaeota archaeon]|nr:CoA-binding protein [Euryarchaeota archaeon]